VTICSLVIQAIPENLDTVKESLIMIEGVEIHAQDERGKMVVTIEHPNREYCSNAMIDMSRINGVMSTSLVFEYQEDLEPDQIEPTIRQSPGPTTIKEEMA